MYIHKFNVLSLSKFNSSKNLGFNALEDLFYWLALTGRLFEQIFYKKVIILDGSFKFQVLRHFLLNLTYP